MLLIEYDAQTRDALEGALVEANYSVVSARNSRDALSKLQQHSIDIALLSLGRDAGKGWNTVESLTQHQPELRLIVAGAGSEGFAHPLASSAAALFEKPIDLDLLFEALKGLTDKPPTIHDGACRKQKQETPRQILSGRPAATQATCGPVKQQQQPVQTYEQHINKTKNINH